MSAAEVDMWSQYTFVVLEKLNEMHVHLNWTFCMDTLWVAGEGGVASDCKRSTDHKRRTDWDVGDSRPFSCSGLLQRTIDKEAVVVADEGWRDTQGRNIRAL